MCTIVALVGVHPEAPLVLAANRDEFYARATGGVGRILDVPFTIGGRDLRAGGTWMGVTSEGLFVGVTNQRTLAPPDASKRSRGALVMEALKLAEPRAICKMLAHVDGREYNSFNLMFGTADALYVAYGRETEAQLEVARVPQGVHVLPNDKLNSKAFWKVSRAQHLLDDARELSWPKLRERLEQVLSDRTLPASQLVPEEGGYLSPELLRQLMALCVRTPAYGTRSASVVALAPGEVLDYRYTEGPPDQCPFLDGTPLFAEALVEAT